LLRSRPLYPLPERNPSIWRKVAGYLGTRAAERDALNTLKTQGQSQSGGPPDTLAHTPVARCQGWGRGFESLHPLQNLTSAKSERCGGAAARPSSAFHAYVSEPEKMQALWKPLGETRGRFGSRRPPPCHREGTPRYVHPSRGSISPPQLNGRLPTTLSLMHGWLTFEACVSSPTRRSGRRSAVRAQFVEDRVPRRAPSKPSSNGSARHRRSAPRHAPSLNYTSSSPCRPSCHTPNPDESRSSGRHGGERLQQVQVKAGYIHRTLIGHLSERRNQPCWFQYGSASLCRSPMVRSHPQRSNLRPGT
jgi:hypothetical protein